MDHGDETCRNQALEVWSTLTDKRLNEIFENLTNQEFEKAKILIEKFTNTEWQAIREVMLGHQLACEEALKYNKEIQDDVKEDLKSVIQLVNNLQEIQKNISNASEQATNASEQATNASIQSLNASETSVNASEVCNNIFQQIEKLAEKTNINAEQLTKDVEQVVIYVTKAQELIVTLEAFQTLLPDVNQLTEMIENITSEVLPDLRRMQQSLIDQLSDSQIMYDDLRNNIIPVSTDLLEKLTILNEEIIKADISQIKIDLAQIVTYKEEIGDLLTQLNTLITNAESLKNSLIQAIEDKKIESLEEMESHKLLAREQFTILAEEKTKGFTNLATDKTNEFTTLAEEKTKSLTDLAEEKTNEFTILAEEKTKSLTDLAEEKTKGFTDLTEEKTKGLTDLAEKKTNEFTTLAEDKTKGFTDLATDKANEFTTLAKEKIETFLNLIHPINSTYTQYPDETTGLFDDTETPRSLFGGDWEQIFTDKGIFFRTEGGLSAENRDASTGIQLDSMQKLTGEFVIRATGVGKLILGSSGILTNTNINITEYGVQEQSNISPRQREIVTLDNSRQARTSTENRSINMLMKIWKRIG
ncbi:MAG: hypothetical protein KFW21_07115 [Spirochaetota bacterium]|nr:hypothetical protein [Spirochaetota bacterium]